MNHSWVDLDRRFIPWSAELPDVDFLSLTGIYGDNLDWNVLLQRRRVVLLAEAGSGKTTEFDQQHSHLRAAGQYCFLTTCRKIARDGIEGALKVRDRDQFSKWRDSDEPAWLFLDSFDEAKRADFRISEVLDKLASAINGVEGRIHIILSGRYSDWEFKRDLHNLLDCIPLPPPDESIGDQTPDDALIAALNDKGSKSQPEAESPLVVIMSSLDKERVERFAVAKGVLEVEEFLESVPKYVFVLHSLTNPLTRICTPVEEKPSLAVAMVVLKSFADSPCDSAMPASHNSPKSLNLFRNRLLARLCTNLVKSVRVTGRLHQALQIDPRDFYPLGIGR